MQGAPCIPESSTQSYKYHVSHRYSCVSWWWTHSSPKHVEKRTKHTKKNCVDDCLVCRVHPAYQSHPYRVTSTKCRIDTVISLDDGHTVARNMYSKEINILRKIVHQVCFIYKIKQDSLDKGRGRGDLTKSEAGGSRRLRLRIVLQRINNVMQRGCMVGHDDSSNQEKYLFRQCNF